MTKTLKNIIATLTILVITLAATSGIATIKAVENANDKAILAERVEALENLSENQEYEIAVKSNVIGAYLINHEEEAKKEYTEAYKAHKPTLLKNYREFHK
ncbi:hypothetical protein POQMFEI_00072 [Enterococcus phage vB_OCPT_CCS2]|nr:hypothetical protein POQMFEI_00072 [Enterococcus phage vB_OCPT_CCS2]